MNTHYPPATILGTHTRTLYSKLVDDEYELSIWLSENHDASEQTYPTLYVLDALSISRCRQTICDSHRHSFA